MGIKESYQEKADAQLQEWEAWIEQFVNEPGQSVARNASDRKALVSRLAACQRIARIRLEELRSTGEEHWETAKQAVEIAMIDLKRTLDESSGARSGKMVKVVPLQQHMGEPLQRKD